MALLGVTSSGFFWVAGFFFYCMPLVLSFFSDVHPPVPAGGLFCLATWKGGGDKGATRSIP